MAARRRRATRRTPTRAPAAIGAGRTTRPTRRSSGTALALPKVRWGKGARTAGRLAQAVGRWSRRRYLGMSEDHRRDTGGALLFMVAVLMGASVWVHAGTAGRGIAAVTVTLVGFAAYLTPVLCATIGTALIWLPRKAGHRVLGASALTVGVLGLLHLAAPTHRGGGWLGWLIAGPLASVTTPAAAALILLFPTLLGGVVLGRSTIAAVVGYVLKVHPTGTTDDDGVEVIHGEVVSIVDADDDEDLDDDEEDDEPEPVQSPVRTVRQPSAARRPGPPPAPQHTPAPAAPPRQLTLTDSGYQLPPLNLFVDGDRQQVRTPANDAVIANLTQFLTNFKVAGGVVGFTRGPTVSQYAIHLDAGVPVSKISSREKDIAVAVKAKDGTIRLLIPIPGTDTIGVEVPNTDRESVALGDVLRSRAAAALDEPLMIGLGKAIDGSFVVADLANLAHMVVAGATGAGKSVALSSLIASILSHASPDQVKFVFLDPKRVELRIFAGLPHLVKPIVTDPVKAGDALDWVVAEMDRRYTVLADAGVRDIASYNRKVRAGTIPGPIMSRLVVVIDELADLLMVAKKRKKDTGGEEDLGIEDSTVRITQLGRAAGVHAVLATQRPDADVVTPLISANTPTKLAFAVSKLADSMVILGMSGAEKLTGRGDALWFPAGASAPIRIQGAMVTEDEITALVKWWTDQVAKQRQEAQVLSA